MQSKMNTQQKRTLRVEKLQTRQLMAADLVGGELQIEGSGSDDQIEVSQELRTTYVFRFGRLQRAQREFVRVEISGERDRLFDAALVDSIRAEGFGGNDTIINDTDIPSVLYGNDGNDVLRGGSADDILVGGDDNDSLYGRSGSDVLSGGRDNDGLFGGEDFDRLYGGSGANRYLNVIGASDYLYRPDSNDAVIEFRRGSYGSTSFGYFSGGSWSDEQVEVVDMGLRRIHDETGNTRLLKLSDHSRMKFVHKGHLLPGTGDPAVGGWNYRNVIYLHHGTFGDTENVNDVLNAQQNVIHEIGHNWDTAAENATINEFRALSGWSADGTEHRADPDTDFARAYGATNAIEDFATCFAAHFMDSDYAEFIDVDGTRIAPDYSDQPVVQVKLNYMDFLDSRV